MRRPTHYEALSLPRDATSEQVEKAYRFFAAMYEDAALATYSLLDTEQQADARSRIREAYEVLHDPAQRDLYDRSLEDGVPVAAGEERHPAAPLAGPKPPSPAPRPQPDLGLLPEPVTGASLRAAREERGVSLSEIAAYTKIGARFLEYIEADRHGDLPALVYIRGFVQEYARYLGLEPKRTAESYVKRVKPQP